MNKEDYLKNKYLEKRAEAQEAGLDVNPSHIGSVFTVPMVNALMDMARDDVYPDNRFSDDECNAWSIMHIAAGFKKRGKWMDNGDGTYSCPKCQSMVYDNQYRYAKFCFCCGAELER